ncbi:MAG: GTP 3',8-cyclase MoaA [Ignavibacteria bacterium]|jgi:cyclic pyranopterin phosphate synthase|nr:GTP 3',8-cyclase MoaA [Ignavibacteria bacterium]MCU7503869.1 GTP 3',8-cyclase MoaA [Ignavibacteria bacterium]MCU7515910.1 GTP 3',8-cyclase MoaA [Ignavibacteria bacterium]
MTLVLKDRFGRIHDYLRVSLTDKCNLKCIYCTPHQINARDKLDKSEILSFDELLRIIRVFTTRLGIKKVRFTGGEAMARKDIMKFFWTLAPLKEKTGFEFAITTNGTLLKENIEALKKCGLDRVNLSLDSLCPGVFKYITGSDKLQDVLGCISSLEEAGFENLKLNTVVIRDINHLETADFVDFFRYRDITLRFIEFMPFQNNGWTKEAFVSSEEVRRHIEKRFILEKIEDRHQIADLYRVKGYKVKVGFIRPISEHFCANCNRLRIKANGSMKLCLFDPEESEIDLKAALRNGSDDIELIRLISEAMKLKEKEHPDVGSLAQGNRNSMQNIGG